MPPIASTIKSQPNDQPTRSVSPADNERMNAASYRTGHGRPVDVISCGRRYPGVQEVSETMSSRNTP